MNRLEYLTALRRYLEEGGLSAEDISDAMGFYEEIFLDAGVQHEEETARNLGSPKELADKILQDSGIHSKGDAVFQMEEATDPRNAQNQQNTQSDRNSNLMKLVLIIVTSPLWISFICVVFGIAMGFVAAIAAVLFAIFAAGITVFACGIATLFSVFPAGLTLIGAGIILMSIGTLILVPIIKGIWHSAVSVFNWAANGIGKLFGVRRAA